MRGIHDQDRRKTIAVKLPVPDDPSRKGELKPVGGSKCDVFNVILLNQVANTLWLGHSDKQAQTKQFAAVASAMISGGAPRATRTPSSMADTPPKPLLSDDGCASF